MTVSTFELGDNLFLDVDRESLEATVRAKFSLLDDLLNLPLTTVGNIRLVIAAATIIRAAEKKVSDIRVARAMRYLK